MTRDTFSIGTYLDALDALEELALLSSKQLRGGGAAHVIGAVYECGGGGLLRSSSGGALPKERNLKICYFPRNSNFTLKESCFRRDKSP